MFPIRSDTGSHPTESSWCPLQNKCLLSNERIADHVSARINRDPIRNAAFDSTDTDGTTRFLAILFV